jgi:hypothetical protein
MNKFLCALAVGLVAVAAASGQLFSTPQVEADPNKDYTITPEAGPWMIYVHSYTGEQAKQLAKEMCLEIRSRYGVPAWVFNRGEEERKKQQEYLERMHKLTDQTPGVRVRVVRIPEQCAVLLGGYKDMDTARTALDHVKKLKPPENKKLLDVVTIYGHADAEGKKDTTDGTLQGGTFANPFASSFVTRNPTVPMEKPVNDPTKADKLMRELNTGRPYNLLENRSPWTLAVKELTGASTIQSKSSSSSFLDMLGFNKKAGELLNASALQAEEVAKVLRGNGFDAYVLHTKYSSVVTVGSFPTRDDPKLLQLQQKLGKVKIGPIDLFACPLPMPVPH